MKKLILIIFAALSLSVFADHHESAPMTTDGAFTTLMIRIPPLRGPCGSIDQYFVHHHLAMQSLLKVKAEDTGYHSLRRFTGR